MKHVDYIVVGLGIAGITFTEHLRNAGNTFVVFSNTHKGATNASGGILNPTVLKRFTAAWEATSFFGYAIPFYQQLGKRLDQNLINPITITRILNNVEEQNNWVVASDKKTLSQFLHTKIIKNENEYIKANQGLGGVKGGYRIFPSQLMESAKESLKNDSYLQEKHFEYDKLTLEKGSVIYKDIKAKAIVFAEGAAVIQNPYFPCSFFPSAKPVFVPNKGEYIIIKAPNLRTNSVLKGSVMLIPLGNDYYKVGASYGRNEIDMEITEKAREAISMKLKTMISCDFQVVDQVVGVRPTVKDRRPILGNTVQNEGIYFLNGLGTRGLSMAPLLSYYLFEYIEKEVPLPVEVDIRRFIK